MKYSVTINDKPIVIDINETGEGIRISVNDREIPASVVSEAEHSRFLMLLNARSFDTEVYRSNGVTSVHLAGRELQCLVEDERLASLRKMAGLDTAHHIAEVRAPMPGLVVKILHKIGDAVKKGDSLMIVEAMKMENELKSPSDGRITEINVQIGKPVDKGQVLMVMEK